MNVELARMGVAPFCAQCGQGAIFMERPKAIDAPVPVRCGTCGWSGWSRVTIPQPELQHICLPGCGCPIALSADARSASHKSQTPGATTARE